MRRLSFAPRPLTLSQAADAYLGYCEAKGLSPGTLSHYRAAFQRLREFLSDDTDVRSIDTPTLRDLCRHMLDGWPQHVGRPLSGKGLSPKTVRNTVVALRTFFAFLVQEDYRQDVCPPRFWDTRDVALWGEVSGVFLLLGSKESGPERSRRWEWNRKG
jgi:hypothetical protein